MIVSLSEINDDGAFFHIRKTAEWLAGSEPARVGGDCVCVNSDIEFRLDLTRTVNEITVRGKAAFSISSPCSLCLNEVTSDMALDVNLFLSSSRREETSGSDGDADYETYEGEKIDLGDYLREKINISLPFKVVCGEDCRGLCCGCGKNLNEEKCVCVSDGPDPRFAILKDVRI